MSTSNRLGPLTSLELVSGYPVGPQPDEPPLPRVDRKLTPRRALEHALRRALERPPCLVSFSGGRDSSLMLALATHVARRDGLPLPIPITLRFAVDGEHHEDEWQDLVVAHLQLDDWVRLELTHELDFLGPLATRVLRRHGVYYPSNAHAQVPMLQKVGPVGTLVTGNGGDDLFEGHYWHGLSDLLKRRSRPRRGEVRVLARVLVPRWILARRYARVHDQLAWLKPDVEKTVRLLWARRIVGEPILWSRRIRRLSIDRGTVLGAEIGAKLAADHGCSIVHPLLDPVFLASLARWDPFGPGDRSEAVRRLGGELLPDRLIVRSTKAGFDNVFWGPGAKRFSEEWNGRGLSDDVEPDVLRELWRLGTEGLAVAVPLQAAWLGVECDNIHQGVAGGVG